MKLEQGLKKIVITGVLLLPFVPLLVSGELFFPFITLKNFVFRVIIEVIFASWLILALRDEAYRPKLSWILKAFVIFLLVIALADAFGENPFKSFWSNYERMEGFVTLAHLFAYFVVAGSILNTKKLWNYFWNTSIGVSVIVGFYGILQLMGKIVINQGGVRLDATFGNATYLGGYMMIHFFLTLLMIRRNSDSDRENKFLIYIYSAIGLLQLFILYSTATRGAILALLGGLFVAAVLALWNGRKDIAVRQIAGGSLIGLLILVGLFLLVKDSKFVNNSATLSRLSSISLEEGSSRFMVWNMAWQGFKERPLLGWGQENFNFVFNKYYNPKMFAQEAWFDRTHNIIFDWLIAGGVLGLLAYLSILLFGIFYLWKKTNLGVLDKSILTGLLTAYFIQNFFVFDNIVSYFLLASFLAYVHFEGSSEENTLKLPKLGEEKIKLIVLPVTAVLLVLTLYSVNYKAYANATTLIEAIRPHEREGPARNLEAFKRALAYNSFGKSETREQLSQMAVSAANAEGAIPELKAGFLELADVEVKDQAEKLSSDARYQLFFGQYLINTGRADEGLEYLNNALELSPAKQDIRFAKATVLIRMSKFQEAFETTKEAFLLAPEYNQARIIYAVGSIYSNKIELLPEILEKRFGDIYINDQRYVNALINTGKFDILAKIWEKSIETNPSDVKNYISLAAVYLELGQRQNSIQILNKAIEIDPEFKEQGEFYIKEIRAGRNP